MPRFLGLFSKKSKNTDPALTYSSAASDDLSSVSISPTVSGSGGAEKALPQSPSKSVLHSDSARSPHAPSTPVQGDRSSIYPSVANSPSGVSTASSSKLRLPFSRKRHSPAGNSTTSVNTTGSQSAPHREFNSVPRPSFAERERNSVASDGELTDLRRLRPPPSKSAIFAAYADPQGALSTRSLPNEGSQPFSLETPSSLSDPSPQLPNIPGPVSTPKRSFFSWAKSTASPPVAKTKSKSNSSSQHAQDSKAAATADLSNSSFSLKSFRHVGPASPPDNQAQGVCLAVPSPAPLSRPRGPSVGESSQRISVAAFREAQARRSMTGSPVPSFRSTSPYNAPQDPGAAGSRTSLRSGLLKSSIGHDGQQRWNNRGPLASDSDADTSSEGEPSGDEEDRERTVTQRGVWGYKQKTRAKSEVGHGSSRSENVETHLDIPPRSQSSLGQNGPRQRASVSTSALTPSAAAKRASILVNANDPSVGYKRTSRHARDTSVYSNPGASTASGFSANLPHRPVSSSDSSDEDDDAPLATLAPPRRPGSALSTASGSSFRGSQYGAANRNRSNSNVAAARGKPLIDINELMAGKMPSLPTREGRRTELVEERGFTKGNTLLSASASPNTSPPTSAGIKTPALIMSSFLSSSPPNSPTESITSSGFVTAPPSIRTAATSFGQPSPTIPIGEQVTPKRDGLGDRLLRVTKGASSTTPNSAMPSPFSSPLGSPDANTSDGTKQLSFPRPSNYRLPFDASRDTSSTPPAARRSTDLASSTNSKLGGVKLSPPDEGLAEMLGATVKLISKTGESSPEGPVRHETSESEVESEDVSSDENSRSAKGKNSRSPRGSEKGTDEWEKVDPKEVKEYKGKEGILKGKNVLSLGREKNREKEVHTQDLAPKAIEPPIAPIPIKKRAPTPSFSVTSRPPLVRNGAVTSAGGSRSASLAPSTTSSESSGSSGSSGNTRQRSSTLFNPTTLDMSGSSLGASANEARGRGTALSPPALRTPAISRSSDISDHSVQDSPSNAVPNQSSTGAGPSSTSGGRQRSSTMMPATKVSSIPTKPVRPFARRDSPASSIGDSSSGRVPLTPGDGSDIGSTGGGGGGRQPKGTENNGSSMRGGMGVKTGKRRSVCFEDDLKGDAPPPSLSGKGRPTHKDGKDGADEEKRRERRRSEARAAIELGNVINGRGPVDDDDEDENMPINQSMQAHMAAMNPMMGVGSGAHPMQMGSVPSWNGNWGNPMGQQQMLNAPQFMFPQGPADPTLFAAHQHAMMIAKQAYQMAVAQQAVAAAGDEWERGSVVSGYGGGNMYGGGMPGGPMASPYGMRMGGMGMNMNMNMMGMGMGSNWSSAGSGIFPASSRSMFGGINATRSEYGGGGGGGGWSSSRSTYGESFGPPTGRATRAGVPDRDWRESGHAPPVPPIPPHAQANSGGRTSAASRTRTTSQPASPRSTGQRKVPPPSSWKGS
ncbi:hypothetical protein AX15_001367 [Amanita polypyramis BW_CC]|nr:hypothetical protein AX15_001367 [Amanita polypyramis BW_CC]